MTTRPGGGPEVIVALDLPSATDALALVDRLGEAGTFYKVGLELFTRAGPDVVRELGARDKRVFLDLKLHDIPTTVRRAVRAAAATGAELLTVHASGGASMLEAAAEGAREAAEEGRVVRLLGVTLLTSLSAAEVERSWDREILSLRDEVHRLGDLAVEAGLDGLVASPLEVRDLRRRLGDVPLLVTPGIRPEGTDAHDQTRVATPAAAVRAGSDHLVVGRAITRADDPPGALRAIQAEAEEAARSMEKRR